MMGHVFIYRGIGTEKDEVSAQSVISQLSPEAETITLHFHTPGGDVFEGFHMYNGIQNFKANTGKKIIGIVEGVCASIGTLVLGACDEIIMNTTSQMMIHNPFTETKGDANKLRGVADHLDKIKHLLIDVYKKKTGLSEEKLWDLYDKETWLNANEAMKMGFVDDVQDAVKAVAKINLENFMEKKEGLWTTIKNLLSLSKFKNEFTETLTDNRVVIVMSEDEDWTGKQVILEDGSPLEDGTFTLQSGKTITVAAGAITEVGTPAPEDNTNEMDEKIKQLEAQLAEAKAAKESESQARALAEGEATKAKAETLKIQNRVTTIEKDFIKLQQEMQKTIGDPTPPGKGPVIKNADEEEYYDPMGEDFIKTLKARNLR